LKESYKTHKYHLRVKNNFFLLIAVECVINTVI